MRAGTDAVAAPTHLVAALPSPHVSLTMSNHELCWEHLQCGREPGGSKAAELGVCPAATAEKANGINHGLNGGRLCWDIAGTFCAHRAEGSFAENRLSCLSCEFFKQVKAEEGDSFRY